MLKTYYIIDFQRMWLLVPQAVLLAGQRWQQLAVAGQHRCMIRDITCGPLFLHAACRFHKSHKLFLRLPSGDGDECENECSEDDSEEGDAGLTQQHNNLLLLGLARLQHTMPALRTLHIITEIWVDNSAAWSILGRMTHLTALHMEMQQHLYAAVTLGHLSALEPLSSSLKALFITTANCDKDKD
jgi:hypothetical protein